MTALVTGGGGFLGAAIVRALVARGERVLVLGRGRYPAFADEPLVGCVQADLRDAVAVERAFSGVRTCYHVAAKAGYWGDPAEFHAINVGGTAHVIAACRAAGTERLVYTSSPSVVIGARDIRGGDERLPYPRRYLATYPATKAIAERMVLGANGTDGLLTCALRPHLIWGPGDNHLLPRLLARARAGQLVGVGNRRNHVDVIHVDNAARAHLLAAERLERGSPVSGSTYFINQERPVALWPFIDALLAQARLGPVRRYIGHRTAYALGWALERAYVALRRSGEPRMTRFLAHQLGAEHWFSSKRARADLGYHPNTSIEHGLEQLRAELARSSL